MRWCRRRTINMREVHGVGQAAPDLSTRHAAPGGDSYDPWGSAHGEEDRCGNGSHGRCSGEFRECCAFWVPAVNVLPPAVCCKSDCAFSLAGGSLSRQSCCLCPLLIFFLLLTSLVLAFGSHIAVAHAYVQCGVLSLSS